MLQQTEKDESTNTLSTMACKAQMAYIKTQGKWKRSVAIRTATVVFAILTPNKSMFNPTTKIREITLKIVAQWHETGRVFVSLTPNRESWHLYGGLGLLQSGGWIFRPRSLDLDSSRFRNRNKAVQEARGRPTTIPYNVGKTVSYVKSVMQVA